MNKTEELKLDYLTMNLINKINDLYYLIKKDINDDKKDLRLTMKYTIKDLEDNIRYLTFLEKGLLTVIKKTIKIYKSFTI
jgi:hypothetical protein